MLLRARSADLLRIPPSALQVEDWSDSEDDMAEGDECEESEGELPACLPACLLYVLPLALQPGLACGLLTASCLFSSPVPCALLPAPLTPTHTPTLPLLLCRGGCGCHAVHGG